MINMSLSKTKTKKLKKYIENDKFTKLRRYISENEIHLDEIITKKGEKMLHLAAKEGAKYCLEFLLEEGANAKLVDKKGNLPLHRALQFVLDDYSRDNERDLVSRLLTYSSGLVNLENFSGVAPKDLILSLEKVKEKKIKSYESPFVRDDLRLEKARSEAEEWQEKIAEECHYEYENSFGKFDDFSRENESTSETFDNWADRIFEEFYNKRKKTSRNTEPKSPPKAKNLKPELDLTQVDQNYKLLKEKKQREKQEKLCEKLFTNRTGVITLSDLPFKDLKAEQILEIVTAKCGSQAADIKKRIREELLRWHPDKFRQKLGDRIEKDQLSQVMDHVKHVSQILINYGK